jgi:phage gp29-like protein
MTGLVDLHGQPLRKDVLKQEVAGATLAGVRSPFAGYPADGLNPVRLANILREADQGNPLRYFELAELIEERDLHYAGVLGTRKRSVSQIDVTVEAASDDPLDVQKADMVREWLRRDELADETIDILDAIGKGDSFTEIMWDTSSGQWMPARLEWRDPRWFSYDPIDGRTPLLRGGEDGNSPDSPLPDYKFIRLTLKAKSGLPVRGGLARLAVWSWMFKAFTQRDWAIFAQTYGQPVRVGKFHPGATKEDKATLFRAVANIAGDCAAIVPEGMMIEFIESANVGAGSDLYERRADWLDRQVSKAVLGQTGTTDMKSGGLGDGGNKVHDRVAGDIEKADCKSLAAALNRDLIRPWMDLEYGPGGRYPRIKIERPKQEDLDPLISAIEKLVPMGLRVQASEIRDKLGISDPDPGAELLHAPMSPQMPPIGSPAPSLRPSLHGQQPKPAALPADAIGDTLAAETAPEIAKMAEAIEAMLDKARDLDEFREMLFAAYPDIDTSKLGALIAPGLVAAAAAGMSDVEAESA